MAMSRPTPHGLPDPLRSLFLRQRRDWQVSLLGTAGALIVLGAGLIWFEAEPPLSTEEQQLIGVGVLMILAGIGAIARAVVSTEPAFHMFTTADVVWIHHVVQRGGAQFIRFGTALGNLERLRLDVPGVQLYEIEIRSAIEAMARVHPLAVVGYSPELDRAFRANPTALKRGAPVARSTIADRMIARRGPLVLATFMGAVLLVFAAVPVFAAITKGPPIPEPTIDTPRPLGEVRSLAR